MTVRVSDGKHNGTLSLAVSVTGINDPPLFASQTNGNVHEGHATFGELYATDPENDNVSHWMT